MKKKKKSPLKFITSMKSLVRTKRDKIEQKNESIEYFDSLKSTEKGIDIAGMLHFKN
jgi:hypothetical protein